GGTVLPKPLKQQQKLSKRRCSSNLGFKHPTPGKRRRRAHSESDSVLPTNFLLGGNIFDPLNLNSLLDEEVNRALNAETPKSSPLPAKSRDPVEILIPRDITDPLNLNSGIAGGGFLVSSFRSGGRHRNRHRNRNHVGVGAGGVSAPQPLDISEPEKGCAVSSGASALPTGSSASASGPGESRADPHAPGEAQEHKARRSPDRAEEGATSCRSTPQAPLKGPESSTGPSQPPCRRRRRRNPGKTDAQAAQSAPVGKARSEESRCWGAASGRSSQASHTPANGSKPAPGCRQQQQQQQASHQRKQQPRQKFQYGNYSKYYGYRTPGASEDPRTRVLRPEWFQGKKVLDLGCNAGHMTLHVARDLRPASILGLDIDRELVKAARKNVRHYLSELHAQRARRAAARKDDGGGDTDTQAGGRERERERERRAEGETQEDAVRKDTLGERELRAENGVLEGAGKEDARLAGSADDKVALPPPHSAGPEDMEQENLGVPPPNQPGSRPFPVSLRITRGPIAAPPFPGSPSLTPGEFPSNVSFVKANYVLENDALLSTQRPEYDVIMCLSVTKWVHLNWGDSGLKRFFQRVYRHLQPGGLFILEPQPWESYGRRKQLSEDTYRNYHNIRLKPEQFSTYLTAEVGFASYELVGTPKCSFRGFQRPIYLFHK
ncbi:7SK snRNA methylphosphate capping enzyme-like, partial [Aplochiton taeniatus]